MYRLTAEQRTGSSPDGHSFGYDLAGNRTSADGSPFAFDPANKVTNSGFSYDGDGDLLTDGTASYTWDDRGDLTGRASRGVSLSYGYDARGLREQSSANGGTFYVFDGDTLLGEVSSAGAVQAAYTWGADGPVSERLVPGGRSLWYHFGPQGEARDLTDGTGAVADTYTFSAYGRRWTPPAATPCTGCRGRRRRGHIAFADAATPGDGRGRRPGKLWQERPRPEIIRSSESGP